MKSRVATYHSSLIDIEGREKENGRCKSDMGSVMRHPDSVFVTLTDNMFVTSIPTTIGTTTSATTTISTIAISITIPLFQLFFLLLWLLISFSAPPAAAAATAGIGVRFQYLRCGTIDINKTPLTGGTFLILSLHSI